MRIPFGQSLTAGSTLGNQQIFLCRITKTQPHLNQDVTSLPFSEVDIYLIISMLIRVSRCVSLYTFRASSEERVV